MKWIAIDCNNWLIASSTETLWQLGMGVWHEYKETIETMADWGETGIELWRSQKVRSSLHSVDDSWTLPACLLCLSYHRDLFFWLWKFPSPCCTHLVQVDGRFAGQDCDISRSGVYMILSVFIVLSPIWHQAKVDPFRLEISYYKENLSRDKTHVLRYPTRSGTRMTPQALERSDLWEKRKINKQGYKSCTPTENWVSLPDFMSMAVREFSSLGGSVIIR